MSVPRYPEQEKAAVADHNGAGPGCDACLGTGRVGTPIGVIPCPDCAAPDRLQQAMTDVSALNEPIRPIDALAHLAPVGLTGLIDSIRKELDDLEAKLEAERTLRANASAELEREKSRERERRIESDAASRDRLWAIDALVEALGPLAGYATEEDGRVAGMTNPVCLAMSSVRRADALVKLHRALRR